jgi:Putative Na+/H+ antiporter
MTICAVLLRHRFYSLKPSERLKYATLGLLFVNISVGGVLTQFGSLPVVIAASAWDWDLAYMLTHFGWKAVIGIILSNLLFLTVFRSEFARLATNVPDEEQDQEGRRPMSMSGGPVALDIETASNLPHRRNRLTTTSICRSMAG